MLADPSAGCVPLRVNLSSQPVWMHSKTHAATCWPAVSRPQLGNETPVGSVHWITAHPNVLPEYLKGLWEDCKGNLTVEQQEIVKTMLLANQEVFSQSKGDLGQTSIVGIASTLVVRHQLNSTQDDYPY